MGYKSWLKGALAVVGMPAVKLLARALEHESVTSSRNDQILRHSVDLLTIARNIAASGDHFVIDPTEIDRLSGEKWPLKIGFFGNIANNNYNIVRILRRMGVDAELVIENGCIDAFLLSRPFWEDKEVECATYDEGLKQEPGWVAPTFVRCVGYDHDLQQCYQGRYSAIPEVQQRYAQAFGRDLPADKAFLLAQIMGHWPFLVSMQRYDIVQLSAASIMMGSFSPCHHVVMPTGSDLFISPFEESFQGLLFRAGYTTAKHIIPSGTNYPEYLMRLCPSVPATFLPMIVDTDIYIPGDEPEIRKKWVDCVGGRLFLLGVCRQSWKWKGNDHLLRGFALAVTQGDDDWRLVLQEWGPDIDKSKALIAELGLETKVLWEPLCSKPLLRRRQRAADAIADQFVMEGYGTSVLESMAAKKPIIIRRSPSRANTILGEVPPFVAANDPAEIADGLRRLSCDVFRAVIAEDTLRWLKKIHGSQALEEKYLDVYYQTRLGRLSVASFEKSAPKADLSPRVQAA